MSTIRYMRRTEADIGSVKGDSRRDRLIVNTADELVTRLPPDDLWRRRPAYRRPRVPQGADRYAMNQTAVNDEFIDYDGPTGLHIATGE